MRESKGNMYGFVTHTWNPIKGKCIHDCSYCYMKQFGELKPLRMSEKELNEDLGSGNFIFVGSSTDMFASNVPKSWILDVLEHCRKYPENKYLFQTKNPIRFYGCMGIFPENTTLGVTIESNEHHYQMNNSPTIEERFKAIKIIQNNSIYPFMITVEPIMDFNLKLFVANLKAIKPKWINIGADSKGHKLVEPSKEKTLCLIEELKTFTTIVKKSNLSRLLK